MKRLRELQKKQRSATVIKLTPAQKLEQQKHELNQRHQVFGLLARIARRPLTIGPGFLNLRVVSRLLNMSRWKLASMVRLANSCLDGPTRAIFFANCVKILRYREDVSYHRWLQSSPIFAIPKFRFIVQKQLEQWISTCSRRGFMLILRVRLSVCASPCLLDMFENTKRWSKRELHQFSCPCSTMFATPFHKLEGCVFFPLSLFLRFLVGNLPPAWNVRTRMVPDWLALLEDFATRAQTLHAAIRPKLDKILHPSLFPSLRFGGPSWERIWHTTTSHLHCQALEDRLDNLKTLLRNYVVAPIGKIRGEAMIMCPLRWARAVENLSSDYFPVTASDYNVIMARLFKLGHGIPHLVYSRLRAARHHQFSFMKAWVKGKCLQHFPECWSELSWRPLLGYSAHHWRHTLSFLARYCSFIVKRYKLGVGLGDPWEMLVRVSAFNQAWLEALLRPGDIALEWDSLDIEDFFPRMERLRVREVLERWTRQLLVDHPRLKFFCVSKVLQTEVLASFPVSAGGRNRRTRLVRKTFLARTLTRYEVGMELSSIPALLGFEFQADVVHVLGRPMRAATGLNIGSPLAATGASMVAGDAEHTYLEALPAHIETNLPKMHLSCRWQDDVLQFRFSRHRFPDGFLALETMLANFSMALRFALSVFRNLVDLAMNFLSMANIFCASNPLINSLGTSR